MLTDNDQLFSEIIAWVIWYGNEDPKKIYAAYCASRPLEKRRIETFKTYLAKLRKNGTSENR